MILCDRCKKTIDDKTKLHIINGKEYDLCRDCSNLIIEVIESPVKTIDDSDKKKFLIEKIIDNPETREELFGNSCVSCYGVPPFPYKS